MTTKDKLLHIAAQMDQLKREIHALAQPVSHGGAPDVSLAASHKLGVVQGFLFYGARKLTEVADAL